MDRRLESSESLTELENILCNHKPVVHLAAVPILGCLEAAMPVGDRQLSEQI